MRNIYRLTALVLSLCTLFAVIPFSANAAESDFEYTVTDGEAIVTAYNGSDTAVTIPATLGGAVVTEIGEEAFLANTTMTSVAFPNTLEVIGSSAFNACTALTAVSFPESLVTIEAMAFYNCSSLKNISITNYTYDIGYQAFHNTAWFLSSEKGMVYLGRVLYNYIGVIEPDTVLTVQYGTAAVAPYAFANRSNLKGVYLPVGLRTIGDFAFLNCSSLEFVRIPSSVVNFGANIFHNAENVKLLGVVDSPAATYANENKLFLEHDPTLNYPDGDMDKNGLLNSSDIRTLLRIIAGMPQEYDLERYWSGDINYDGVVNTSDIRDLLFISLFS